MVEPVADHYEELAVNELEAAARATSPEVRNAHLNQAAIYATLSEERRFKSVLDRSSGIYIDGRAKS